jgi:hypothetical protein
MTQEKRHPFTDSMYMTGGLKASRSSRPVNVSDGVEKFFIKDSWLLSVKNSHPEAM